MSHEHELTTLRAALRRLPRRGRGRAYPESLRHQITTYLHARRAEGVAAKEAARELGISLWTVLRWTRAAPQAHAFERVTIVDASQPRGAIVVYGPSGLRVEGLDLAGVAELLRRLA